MRKPAIAAVILCALSACVEIAPPPQTTVYRGSYERAVVSPPPVAPGPSPTPSMGSIYYPASTTTHQVYTPPAARY